MPANVEQSQTGGGVLVVQTFPTGDSPRFLVLDPASGATRGRSTSRATTTSRSSARHLVRRGRGLAAGALRLHGSPAGYGLDGAIAWRRSLKLGRTRDKSCDSYFARDVAGDVALNASAGRPLLLDPATGRTR